MASSTLRGRPSLHTSLCAAFAVKSRGRPLLSPSRVPDGTQLGLEAYPFGAIDTWTVASRRPRTRARKPGTVAHGGRLCELRIVAAEPSKVVRLFESRLVDR